MRSLASRPQITSLRLQEFFRSADIRILDVGARGGPLAELSILAPYSSLFLCEPDKAEAERLKSDLKIKWRALRVMPVALGMGSSEVELNVTRYAGLSSLLEPNHKIIKEFFPSFASFKKESAEAWEVVKREKVPLISLDDAYDKYGCGDLSLLKLDTQGTELSILSSGARKVIPSTLAVYAEAEFVPLYSDQPLFSPLNQFLEKKGFRLLDIKRSFLRRIVPCPRPLFSKRELVYAHAFYVREKNDDGSPLSAKAKMRLACIVFTFWYFDYALRLLRDADVVKFLELKGFENIDKEICVYANAVWQSVKSGLSKKDQEKYLNFAFQDKIYEI